jgi:Antitoxin SocA-like, Panacea domain
MQSGKSITGQDYRKAPFGPMGAEMETTLSALKDEEALAIARRQYHGKRQQRPLALRDLVLDEFTAAEIALVNEVIDDLWEQTAAEVSQVSHDFIGWQAARMGEIIPYETCLVDISPLTDEEQEWARQVAQAAA